ncbi:hypothetical protein B5M09_008674 [Aphanomyces astaci]|uniref:Centromere protein S n=1 Tax=Aphanomyces astaci TaxID=112090 RepID=A0A3R7WKG4_APHAT|nr:hypothetical protein B5M09_008674 [Aphanomyces astaci]
MEERRAMLFAVSSICEEVATRDSVSAEYASSSTSRSLRPTLSPDALQVLTEVAMKQLELVAHDLQHFAHHANRRTISPEDVMLTARRQAGLVQNLVAYQRQHCLANSTGGGSTKSKRKRKDSLD